MFQMIQVYISTHSYCKQSLVFSDFHLEFYRFVWDNEFVIHLFYPTKNDKSRTIALSNFVLTALHRAHRRKLENKLLYGPAWEDSGFVFTDELGHHSAGLSPTPLPVYSTLGSNLTFQTPMRHVLSCPTWTHRKLLEATLSTGMSTDS